ncbi:MAG TPA: hypothetical protein VEA69_25490 [Tepidisphaeraceae bacterium]|nr:hypothetical protein [Tepidisphaeraceae bacterium]
MLATGFPLPPSDLQRIRQAIREILQRADDGCTIDFTDLLDRLLAELALLRPPSDQDGRLQD